VCKSESEVLTSSGGGCPGQLALLGCNKGIVTLVLRDRPPGWDVGNEDRLVACSIIK
jgi:hypothetical protein